MKEAIQRRALELGFDDCRFTNANPPASANQFQGWLAEKRHGEMTWLERTAEKRVDPQKILPGAKSVICLAASYAGRDEELMSKRPLTPSLSPSDGERVSEGRVRDCLPSTLDPRPSTGFIALSPSDGERVAEGRVRDCLPSTLDPRPLTGFVARYAQFDDYHDVLAGSLKQLTALVNQLGTPETHSLWYVDTGPLLERVFAQRAGLGFIGKHTNVISRKFGNWILLAEIITTLELEPDAPEENHCGKCARCITACPTNAITAPFQLDARRCISYLTIELKGPIPVELRPAIGNRIFGCDDCLAVCPWNRFAREGNLMKTHARRELAGPDLIELLQLDETGFKSRFAGTPVLRTKRRGLLRNVCVALGNVGDASALPHLEKAAANSEPLIAEHARWAIGQIESRL